MKRLAFFLLIALLPMSRALASGPAGSSFIEVGTRVGIGAIMPAGSLTVQYSPAFAWGLDLNFTHMFNEFFGFSTGVNYTSLASSITGSDIVSSYTGDMEVIVDFNTHATMNSRVRCVGSTTSVKESYQSAFLEIPALLAIHNDLWYYNIGLKFAVPLQLDADYEYGTTLMMVDSVCLSGTKLDDPMPQPSAPGSAGEYDALKKPLPLYVLLSLEIGYHVELTNHSSLSIGAFLDYGLNDATISADDKELLELDGCEIVDYRGAMNSNVMNAIRYYKMGFRVLYNLGFGSGKSSSKASRPYSRSRRLL